MRFQAKGASSKGGTLSRATGAVVGKVSRSISFNRKARSGVPHVPAEPVDGPVGAIEFEGYMYKRALAHGVSGAFDPTLA